MGWHRISEDAVATIRLAANPAEQPWRPAALGAPPEPVQPNRLCSTMVCSRSGPVEMIATAAPLTSSMRLR